MTMKNENMNKTEIIHITENVRSQELHQVT